jgi:hypothetical protein
LFWRVFFTRTGTHPRIKSEGRLSLENALRPDCSLDTIGLHFVNRGL